MKLVCWLLMAVIYTSVPASVPALYCSLCGILGEAINQLFVGEVPKNKCLLLVLNDLNY